MIYEIKTYDLIGKIIKTYKERPDLRLIKGEHGQKDYFVDEEGRKEDCIRPDTEYSDSLGTEGDRYKLEDVPVYLPYFADVTEDLPAKFKFEPKTYKNCQLLTQKHGGYLEFFHHESGETLRIAMNSNTYSPLL